MEDYYSVVFFLLIFMQDHLKGFLCTVTCFMMVKLNAFFAANMQFIGFTYYESYMFYEALVFAVSIFLLGSRLGVILCVTSVTAFFINFIGYLTPNGIFYQWYYSSYGVLQIILFEVLVWGCLINSRLKPYIKDPNKVMRKLKAIKI